MTTTRPIPEHGTASRYRGDPRKKRWIPCRCELCRSAYRRQYKAKELRIARGQGGRHPITPVVTHIELLLESGWTLQDIEQTANVDRRGMYNMRHGLQKTVNHATAAKILSLRPQDRSPQMVDATGTARRIQALVAIGWSIRWMADQAGISHGTLEDAAGGQRQQVTVATHQTVSTLYRQYARRPGPSGWARAFAARKGWVSPMAWDDIDNPDAQPDVDSEPDRKPDQSETARYVSSEIQHLAAFNLSEEEIAKRVGRSRSYVHEQLAGRRGPGWRNQLQTAA